MESTETSNSDSNSYGASPLLFSAVMNLEYLIGNLKSALLSAERNRDRSVLEANKPIGKMCTESYKKQRLEAVEIYEKVLDSARNLPNELDFYSAGAFNHADLSCVIIDGVDKLDYPKFSDAWIVAAKYRGKQLGPQQIDLLNEDNVDNSLFNQY